MGNRGHLPVEASGRPVETRGDVRPRRPGGRGGPRWVASRRPRAGGVADLVVMGVGVGGAADVLQRAGVPHGLKQRGGLGGQLAGD